MDMDLVCFGKQLIHVLVVRCSKLETALRNVYVTLSNTNSTE